ncbi:response regulator [Chitinophaga polysaccharea]|uniref:hybrid sensor histidine kinase/response regulator transcription factor n=1 Tax=Chitinophaga polysaccharea TaxID=1293035 RepID=UPI0014551233|nr:two-component regulator propeller domain-containing protein [Chitinophaga polysaccharea]NLR58545.1 response regulator [Chitinophaga polysaccharea]
MRKRAIIFFFFLLFTRTLPGQTLAYQFNRIDINQGLSNNQVNCIFRDSTGFLWIGTGAGLNRFDGYHFTVYLHDLRDSSSLSDNNISQIMEGPARRLWIRTRSGINIYDPVTGRFNRHPEILLQQWGIPGNTLTAITRMPSGQYWLLHPTAGIFITDGQHTATRLTHNADTSSIATNSVAALVADKAGDCWLLHSNGILEKMDSRSHRVLYRNNSLAGANWSMVADNDGDLWLFNNNEDNGVYHFNTRQYTFRHIDQHTPGLALNNNIVRGIVPDNNGLIWVGTDHGGINIIDKKAQQVRYIENISEDSRSLSQNSINALYKDNTGIIWIGTFKKGLNYYHENMVKFPLYQNMSYSRNSLPFNDVNRFVEDDKGNLWIGTNGGGLIYFDRSRNTFTTYRHDPANANSISGNVVVSLLIDHARQLWVGTYFGGLDRFDGHRFVHYKHDPKDSSSLSDNSIWELLEDSQHRLWVGTLAGGLNQLDPVTNKFAHFRPAVPSKYVSALLEDKQGSLWVGTSDGLDIRSPGTGIFRHYSNDPNNPASLSHNNIVCIFQDSQDRVWIGTREGLDLYNPKDDDFTTFRKSDGLPDNTVLNILEANDHSLWMSTPNGLCNMTFQPGANGKGLTYHFKNYDESDGLQGKDFNENAALKTSRGELIFGGGNGFNLFYPTSIALNKNIPPVVLTDLQIFNKSILPGEKINGRVLLPGAISEIRSITLQHGENVFSLEFASLNYFHPEKNQYAYMLEGFNKDWLYTDGTQRRATFTNLDPGEYTFRVKASNNDGVWNDAGLTLKIRVLPPFWKTWPAFLCYVLLIIGALLLARRIILERERLKFRMAQQTQEAARMHELDSLKIRFFTNVSHEFRTPLSLIITPLEKIIKQTAEAPLRSQLELMQRNARRLLSLVNQLLDFRKMEVQEIKLHTGEGDIISFLRELTGSFSDLSDKKHISLTFQSNVQELKMLYDADKIEKILFNLLSNAFKFTPEDGAIGVQVQYRESDAQLEIAVKDNGIGIPLEKQDHIFERFFQHDLPASVVNQGSGIGLSITKEFVKMHGGNISVDSAPEMGSCFTVVLPVKAVTPAVAGAMEETIRTQQAALAVAAPVNNSKKPVVLLVEDNEDFRFYLKDNLSQYFQILEAENGLVAWKLLQQTLPHLIVSDISMPEMDGLELCKKVRAQQRTTHLPVVLLTARAEEAQQLEALETGASDYITKPFNFEVLLSRLRNIISQQTSLRKTFQQHIEANPSEIAISSADEQFIQQALQIVEKNISNPDFSVEELSRALFMSRVSVYKKILALTGRSPIEFIRSIRLKRAVQLLEKSQLTVAEVAYEVGFNNPKYFTRYFKMEYNVLPSQYKAESIKRKA